ncbi:hypothetical protein [Pedobacter antarcticus]|nr:hypothetical protein [Pedobacter antarcticus]
MKNKLLKIALVIATIILLIFIIRIIQNTNGGTPHDNLKKSPISSPK